MKIRVFILFIVGVLLCGCNNTEVYSRDYLESEGPLQYCSEYAVTYHSGVPGYNESGYNIIYQSVGSNEFQKLFEVSTASSLFDLDIHDGYIYIINRDDTSNLIYAYELEGEHESISWDAETYIHGIREYFGKNEEYLYFSYYDRDRNLTYGRLSLDLQNFLEIEKEDIPENLTRC